MPTDGRSWCVTAAPPWQPDSRQVVFSFAVDDLARAAGVVVPVHGRHSRARPETDARARSARARPAAGAASKVRWPGSSVPSAWNARTIWKARARPTVAALELDPDLADAYINLGRLTHQAGDSAEAARLYHLALEAAPDDPIAHYNLAIALEDQRHFSEALAHYRQALTLDPEFADAHFNIARLLGRLGQRRRPCAIWSRTSISLKTEW